MDDSKRDAANRPTLAATNSRTLAIGCMCCLCLTARRMNSRDPRANRIQARWRQGDPGVEDDE
jgi:hypothetical protein